MAHYTTLVQRCRATNSLLADEIEREFHRIERAHDEQMERLKACEHIADGDDGWEKLSELCPSTAAVSRLRGTNIIMRTALKTAADYWADWHVPCVYSEYDNDCEICPVIEVVRAALEPTK